ncbi:MAG: aminotransferase class V-fold PLP-dependent enzyme, partial [Planctomycetota bacterium]
MDRRSFLATGVATVAGMSARDAPGEAASRDVVDADVAIGPQTRAFFPRLESQVFLNAASGTPLSTFAEAGLRRVERIWRDGSDDGAWRSERDVMPEARSTFARLIGARPEEIALVHCTKAGEQIVLDGLEALARGGNVVTNDMHFSGSLHDLLGRQRAGLDVRIVRGDGRDVPLREMEAVMDDRTALVSVTLVSNINGRVEPIRELVELAHARGAYVYADIIQAAGVMPIDVRELGVDFAACSGYKWMFGPHGVGFFYVRQDLQGT